MKIGCLAYINSLPVTWGLESGAVAPGTDIVAAQPSRLNELTRQRALDVTPVSSIQWLHCHENYRPVPGVALSSRGPVQSVMLFSRVPIGELKGRKVAITGATATSRVLLQILVPGIVPVPIDEPADACLLIGDQALLERPEVPHVLDLGQAWFERTGLPMVFAMWLVKRELVDEASQLLGESQRWGETHPQQVLGEAELRTGLSRARLQDYYSGLYFTVGEAERRGLFEYYRQAALLGLAPGLPDEIQLEFENTRMHV
jgi:chorismate dehydratase